MTTSSYASASAFVPLANRQAECPKQDNAEYLELVASDAADNGVCGDSKPSSWQANCRDQHDDDYLQLVANDDYFQPIANDFHTQLAANDNFLQHVALDIRYYQEFIN